MLLWNSALPAGAQSAVANSSDTLKVLFIGNSYTFANDMPKIFAAMMRSGTNNSKPLKIFSSSFPNYTLKEHLADSRTMTALENEGPWDYVILQERSHFPISEQAQMEESCAEFDKKIRARGARTMLLETWADQNDLAHQETINSCFKKISSRINAPVISVGDVWPNASHAANLYGDDGHHPSIAGSYLVAACVYKTLTGKDPRQLGPDAENSIGLSTSVARQLKDIVSSGTTSAVTRTATTSARSAVRPTSQSSSSQAPTPSSNGNSNRGVTNYRW